MLATFTAYFYAFDPVITIFMYIVFYPYGGFIWRKTSKSYFYLRVIPSLLL